MKKTRTKTLDSQKELEDYKRLLKESCDKHIDGLLAASPDISDKTIELVNAIYNMAFKDGWERRKEYV